MNTEQPTKIKTPAALKEEQRKASALITAAGINRHGTSKAGARVIAEHEAAHAVMRWYCGLPAASMSLFDDGGCVIAGKGRAFAMDLFYVAVAGFAWDNRGLPIDVATSSAQDFNNARKILETPAGSTLRLVDDLESQSSRIQTIDETIQRHLALAFDVLDGFRDAVEYLGQRLLEKRMLSSRSVASILCGYGRRWSKAASEKIDMNLASASSRQQTSAESAPAGV